MQKQTTAKGFAILSMAGVVNKILALVYVPVQTYIIGNYGNGIVNAGYAIYIFIFYLSNAGIPTVLSKLISEQSVLHRYKNCQKIFRFAGLVLFSSGVFFTIFMALGAHWISRMISQPEASLMILALSPTLLFTSIASAFRGYFQGRSNMIPTAFSQILEQAVNSILTVVFAALLIKYGVDKAAAGTTLGTSIGAFSAAAYLFLTYMRNRKTIKAETLSSVEESNGITYKNILKTMAKFCIPAIISTIVINSYGLLDLTLGVNRLIAGGIKADIATELYGIFTTQYQRILNIPLIFTAALPTALIPAVSAAVTLSDNKLLQRKISEAFRIIFIILIPAAMGLTILSKPIITLVFFSTTLNQGSDLLMLGSWTIILSAVISTQSAILIGIGKPLISPINLTIGMIIKAFINYFLIARPDINIKGAIIGSLLGYSFVCLLNYIAIKRLIKIPLNLVKLAIKPLVSAMIMALLTYLSYSAINLAVSNFTSTGLLRNAICTLPALILGAVLYLILLIKFKAINSLDISKLPAGNRINSLLLKMHLL